MPPWLQPHLDDHGRMRFDMFMQLALYDDEHGYYTTRISGVGRDADFSTTATLSTTLGRALAMWIHAHPQRQVIEVGAGNGALAEAIRRSLPLFSRTRLRYHIVERSPVLRELQQQRLGNKATWHEELSDALHAAKGDALILSNELIDAFPARIFRATGRPDTYEELFLAPDGDRPSEVWQTATDLPESTVFSHSWPEGQRLEVLASYHSWLAGWVGDWKSGAMISIDYGGNPKEIYHRRPDGSLRGYFFHNRITGPDLYQHPGRQDLTADVNFDDLQAWGSDLGLTTTSLQSQADFLKAHAKPTDSDTFLTDPHGVGGAFRVLEQVRA